MDTRKQIKKLLSQLIIKSVFQSTLQTHPKSLIIRYIFENGKRYQVGFVRASCLACTFVLHGEWLHLLSFSEVRPLFIFII